MKNISIILTFFAALFLSTTIQSQDLIVKQDGEVIKCKVEELTEHTIRYKKFDNLTGPIYNINKKEVVTVNFENGTIEVIQQTSTRPATPPAFNSQNRAQDFRFYDRTVTVSYVAYDGTKGFAIDYEESVFSDNLSLRLPLYFVLGDQDIFSMGLNLKYYLYKDTWVSAFVGPEVNVGYVDDKYLNDLGIQIATLQVLGDVGFSITPIDKIKITTHLGLGYGDAFLLANDSNRSLRLENGFTFNFNVGIGYSF